MFEDIEGSLTWNDSNYHLAHGDINAFFEYVRTQFPSVLLVAS